MEFVELNRDFALLQKDQEPSVDMGRVWGRRYGGWLTWEGLLKYCRVVLLAEASSGKSEEFCAQTEKLIKEGKAAFFVRIEELAAKTIGCFPDSAPSASRDACDDEKVE